MTATDFATDAFDAPDEGLFELRVADAPAPEAGDGPRMTPGQMRTFNELLAVGGERPTAPPLLVAQLREYLTEATAPALSRWSERTLWVGKSPLETVLRCESKLVAERARPFDSTTMHPAIAVGNVAHRAIQISHTHPGRAVATYVDAAIDGARTEEAFGRWWDECGLAAQSDLITSAMSRVTAWLDSWPALDASWTPRFEEPIQVRLGRLVLSAKPDIVLGRPRPDGRQTMLIADLKTGALDDHHLDEARFYALVAALRHSCPPFRSAVYSLASGDWTEPDVTADALWEAARRVVAGVESMVDALGGHREPAFGPGRWCRWCVAADGCAGREAWVEAGQPDEFVFEGRAQPVVLTTKPAAVASPDAAPAPAAVASPAATVSSTGVADEAPVETAAAAAPDEDDPFALD